MTTAENDFPSERDLTVFVGIHTAQKRSAEQTSRTASWCFITQDVNTSKDVFWGSGLSEHLWWQGRLNKQHMLKVILQTWYLNLFTSSLTAREMLWMVQL